MLISGATPPHPCGVGDYTDALASALADLPGNSVAVLTGQADKADRVTAPDRNYTILRPLRSWRLSETLRAWRALRAWRPDVVHLQYPTMNYDGALSSIIAPLARIAGATVVRTWHEAFPRAHSFRFLTQMLGGSYYSVVRPDFERRTWAPLRLLLRSRRRAQLSGSSAIPASTLSLAALGDYRARLLDGAERLIVFFGFLYPEKGVEGLFAAANPATDRLIIAGDTTLDAAYSARIAALCEIGGWQGRATLVGYQSPAVTADLLAAADVVVLPFISGGGSWNSSIHAALTQGTPVITTTASEVGQSVDAMIQYVAAGDRNALQAAVRSAARWDARRIECRPADEWTRIAVQHMELYRAAGSR